MLNSQLLRYSSAGRVLVEVVATPSHFNGGTPCLADGTLCGSEDDPDQYVAGFGYTNNGKICARDGIPNGEDSGGLARTGIGSLALDLVSPIVGYIAGLPVTDEGRLAVELIVPPPSNNAFSSGFSEGFA